MRMLQNNEIIEKELSYRLGGIFFNIQNRLGRFCRERQYADALETELKNQGFEFEREFPISLEGRKSNFVDFLVEDKVLIDLKAKPFIEKDDYYQMRRYLESADLKLGLIVNFRHRYLQPKRVLNSKFSQHSHPFAVSHRAQGFTLVELIVAVGLFLVIVAIAAGSFVQALRAQRQISGLIAAQSNVGLVLEQMAREIRTGYDFCHDAGGNPTCFGPGELVFTNALSETIAYRLNGTSIEQGVGGSFGQITGGNVSIQYLNFILSGAESGDGWPPRITISLGVSSKEAGVSGTVVRLETTVSARTIDT